MNKSRVKKYMRLYKTIPFKWLVWKNGVTKQSVSNYNKHRRTGEKTATIIERNINEAVEFMKEYDSVVFSMDDKIRINTDSLFLAVGYSEIHKELSAREAHAKCVKDYVENPVKFKIMLTKLLIKHLEEKKTSAY